MSKRFLLQVILCVLAVAIGYSANASTAIAPAPEWQYKVVYIQPASDNPEGSYAVPLDEFGTFGWEVVSQASHEGESGIWYTLKRTR